MLASLCQLIVGKFKACFIKARFGNFRKKVRPTVLHVGKCNTNEKCVSSLGTRFGYVCCVSGVLIFKLSPAGPFFLSYKGCCFFVNLRRHFWGKARKNATSFFTKNNTPLTKQTVTYLKGLREVLKSQF